MGCFFSTHEQRKVSESKGWVPKKHGFYYGKRKDHLLWTLETLVWFVGRVLQIIIVSIQQTPKMLTSPTTHGPVVETNPSQKSIGDWHAKRVKRLPLLLSWHLASPFRTKYRSPIRLLMVQKLGKLSPVEGKVVYPIILQGFRLEVGSLSHDLQGFSTIPGGYIARFLKPSTNSFDFNVLKIKQIHLTSSKNPESSPTNHLTSMNLSDNPPPFFKAGTLKHVQGTASEG